MLNATILNDYIQTCMCDQNDIQERYSNPQIMIIMTYKEMTRRKSSSACGMVSQFLFMTTKNGLEWSASQSFDDACDVFTKKLICGEKQLHLQLSQRTEIMYKLGGAFVDYSLASIFIFSTQLS